MSDDQNLYFVRPQFNHGPPDSRQRHAGDLGNIEVKSDGTAQFVLTDKLLSLVGGRSIIGRSIVIDQEPDDFTRASDRGRRPALCGVIGRVDWKKLNARFYVNPKLKQQIQFHPCQLYVNRLILQQFTMVYSVSFRLFSLQIP